MLLELIELCQLCKIGFGFLFSSSIPFLQVISCIQGQSCTLASAVCRACRQAVLFPKHHQPLKPHCQSGPCSVVLCLAGTNCKQGPAEPARPCFGIKHTQFKPHMPKQTQGHHPHSPTTPALQIHVTAHAHVVLGAAEQSHSIGMCCSIAWCTIGVWGSTCSQHKSTLNTKQQHRA